MPSCWQLNDISRMTFSDHIAFFSLLLLGSLQSISSPLTWRNFTLDTVFTVTFSLLTGSVGVSCVPSEVNGRGHFSSLFNWPFYVLWSVCVWLVCHFTFAFSPWEVSRCKLSERPEAPFLFSQHRQTTSKKEEEKKKKREENKVTLIL